MTVHAVASAVVSGAPEMIRNLLIKMIAGISIMQSVAILLAWSSLPGVGLWIWSCLHSSGQAICELVKSEGGSIL